MPLALGVDIPPEQVRDAVIEAGRAVPNLAEPDGVKCFVTGIGEGTIKYTVVLSVPNPGILDGPCDEFLSRSWYLAQRRGLRLDPLLPRDPASPVRLVADLDTDVLAIPAQAFVDAMDRSRVVARDISAVTEARRQAILPLNRGLRVVA